jgi:uncharacterized protein
MSDNWRILKNTTTQDTILPRVKWCASFWCKLRGLMFRRHLPAGEGLLFVEGRESRQGSAIHMLFMFLTIGVVWLDKDGRVVDKKLAKPWRPIYTPQAPAQYFIEANPDILDRVAVGDVLQFDETAT